MHLACRNPHSDRLEKNKQNGMVLHHHLDRSRKISGKINVEQAALRPVQLDSFRSRKGDRISDCHPQSLNVGHASNRGVHGKSRNRLIVDNEIDVDSELDKNRKLKNSVIIDYCFENKRLDKSIAKRQKVRICNIDYSRDSKLPHYLVNLTLKVGNKDNKLVPVMARLDSLADVNWISKKLFLELNSKYKITTSPCNVTCKLVDKSEIK